MKSVILAKKRFRGILFVITFTLCPLPSALYLFAYNYDYADLRYAESVRFMQKGYLDDAMVGFMDVILRRPDDEQAREKLRQVSALLIEEEKRKILTERDRLYKETAETRWKAEAINRERTDRIDRWTRNVSGLKREIPDLDRIEYNLAYYRKLLSATPLYPGMTGIFDTQMRALKAEFHSSLKKRYPTWTGETGSLAPRDVATVVFTYKVISDDADIYSNSQFTQKIISKIHELDKMETGIRAFLADADEALALYSLRKYALSLELWKKILKLDPRNSEAGFYIKLAGNRLDQEKVQPPQRTVAVFPVPSNSPPPRSSAKPAIPAAQSGAAGKKTPEHPRGGKITPSRAAAAGEAPAAAERAVSTDRQVSLPETEGLAPKTPGSGQPEREGENAKNSEPYYELGVRQYARGNLTKAIEYWEKCLELDPGDSRAKRAIDRARKELL